MSYSIYKLPDNIKEGDIQTKGEIDTGGGTSTVYEVYYDDKKSSKSDGNKYAVFTDTYFVGWLDLGYSLPELRQMVIENKPKKYKI